MGAGIQQIVRDHDAEASYWILFSADTRSTGEDYLQAAMGARGTIYFVFACNNFELLMMSKMSQPGAYGGCAR
jgi:hypothetical protein